MKINKTILFGFLFIFLAGIIFLTNILNPIIRPITYLFLMGSSKGKDIMFFGILGLFLILSQVINKKIDVTKYLKVSIIIGTVLLVLGILLLSQIIGPFIQSDINTGVGLYSYIPSASFLVILLIPVLFIALVLAIQKRPWVTTFLIAFFSSCLLIGAIDGGMWGTPALVGILGLYLVYRNGYYINYIVGTILKDEKLLKDNESIQPSYRNKGLSEIKYLFNRLLPYIVVFVVIALRFTIALAGAEPDYYTVEIANITDDVDFADIPIEKISNGTYHVDSSYNEMELLNDLRVPLNNSCDYYTVSWNAYSYLK